MDMLTWAKREVELASNRERSNASDEAWDYGCACYDSALKAFESLCEDEHSGMSIGITKNILNRLIEGKCLTPIEDTEDIWNECWSKDGYTEYQCQRMSSFFKRIYDDGTVKYHDINRFAGTYENCSYSYHSGHLDKVMEEMYPITMPYMPENKAYLIYTEDFLAYPENGDFDTVGYLYCITPKGERVEINRYFKEDPNSETAMIEIDHEEYLARLAIMNERLVKEELKDIEPIGIGQFHSLED